MPWPRAGTLLTAGGPEPPQRSFHDPETQLSVSFPFLAWCLTVLHTDPLPAAIMKHFKPARTKGRVLDPPQPLDRF